MCCSFLKRLMKENISLLGIDTHNNTYKISLPTTTEPDKPTITFKSGDLVEVKYEGKWVKAIYVCPSLLKGYHFCTFSEYTKLKKASYHVYTYPVQGIREQKD